MMAAAAAPTLSTDVDVALNLVIAEEGDDNVNHTEEQQQHHINTEQQFEFDDENDDEELELGEQDAAARWIATAVSQESGNAVNRSGYEIYAKQEEPPRAAVEVRAFDFTKIATLFPDVSTTSGTDKSECKDSLPLSPLPSDVEVKKEELGKDQRKNGNSLNSESVKVKKSPSPLNDDKSKRINRNGIAKKRSNRSGKHKKPPVLKTKKRDATYQSKSPPSSPLQRPETPLTPSLDPELLRKFEEEDRPKRVLRSSTIAASMSKKPNGISGASNNSSSGAIGKGPEKKKETKKKKTAKKKSARKPKKLLPNFIPDAVPVFTASAKRKQLNREQGRKRRRSEGDMDEKRPRKRAKTELEALLDVDLSKVLVDSDDLRDFPVQPRRFSSASRASTSTDAFSRYASVIKEEEESGNRGGRNHRKRRLSRARTVSYSSNWKLIGHGTKSYIYLSNDVPPMKGICYKEAQHSRTGDFLRIRDAVRVNSIDGETNFGCIASLFKDPAKGTPLATVLWYYSPKQVILDDTSVWPPIAKRELLASRHIDVVPLDTVDEIVRVLTYNEYARFMAETTNDTYPCALRVSEEDLLWRKGEDDYPRRHFLPCDDTPLELVYFCRRVYDFKKHKVITTRPPPLSKPKNSAGRRSSR